MTPEDTGMPPQHECRGADVAAYALGALDPTEARTFERHLQRCAVCPVELASFQRVVDEMAASAPPYDAPRALKQRVMRAVAEEPRHQAAQPTPRRRRRAPRVPFGVTGLAFGGAMAFAAAAVVVVVLALPGRMGNRTIDATVPGSGAAALHISAGHDDIVLHHFAAPPKGKIYEVWLQHGSRTPTPTTVLFSVPRDGSTTVDVPGSLYGVSHVLVTPEPAGGSKTPTHAPVVNAAL